MSKVIVAGTDVVSDQIARHLRTLGHEVHRFEKEPPEDFDVSDVMGVWISGKALQKAVE